MIMGLGLIGGAVRRRETPPPNSTWIVIQRQEENVTSLSVKGLIIAGALLGIALPASAAQVIVTVDGNSNPFLAGQADDVACCFGDKAPAQSPTLALTGFAEGSILTFSAEGGFNYNGGTPVASADGRSGSSNMTANALGISGAQGVRYDGLVGVFLGDDVNTGAAPSSRNDGTSFAAIAPELYQIFWIGDGLTGTGTGDVQQFTAPVGATRLFLGSVDGTGWFNNTGTSTVTIDYVPADITSAVPEPATWAMMLAGFGLIGARIRRRHNARPYMVIA